jgi:hypothetical protein
MLLDECVALLLDLEEIAAAVTVFSNLSDWSNATNFLHMTARPRFKTGQQVKLTR